MAFYKDYKDIKVQNEFKDNYATRVRKSSRKRRVLVVAIILLPKLIGSSSEVCEDLAEDRKERGPK